MSYIKFRDSAIEYKNSEIRVISDNVIEVTNAPHDISGVGMYLDNGVEVGSYWDYNYDCMPTYELPPHTYRYTNVNGNKRRVSWLT